MYLIPNQPIFEQPVQDNLINGLEKYYPIFGRTEYIYIQWLLGSPYGNCLRPQNATDIRIFTETGIAVYDLGLYASQSVNKNWFTLKFKFSDLGLADGCYYLQWTDCPGGSTTVRTSNPFTVITDTSRTKLITSTCDCYGHGFDWSTFVLQWRVPFAKFNPEYNMISFDDLDSNEVNEKYYAEREKFWSCVTTWMNEGAHDAMTVALLCDTFLVDTVEYYFDKKEYAMENDKEGKNDLFKASFQLKKQGTTTVNNNCQDCDAEIYPYYG